MTFPLRILSFSGAIVLGGLGSSCSQVGNAWIPGSMAGAAQNQIMLVRQDPPSFGYQRLSSQILVYPDLGIFTAKRGIPDFLAETGNGQRHYFILYYLKERKAYACRTRSGSSQTVEFAGPYPITPREHRLLDGFRKDPTRSPKF